MRRPKKLDHRTPPITCFRRFLRPSSRLLRQENSVCNILHWSTVLNASHLPIKELAHSRKRAIFSQIPHPTATLTYSQPTQLVSRRCHFFKCNSGLELDFGLGMLHFADSNRHLVLTHFKGLFLPKTVQNKTKRKKTCNSSLCLLLFEQKRMSFCQFSPPTSTNSSNVLWPSVDSSRPQPQLRNFCLIGFSFSPSHSYSLKKKRKKRHRHSQNIANKEIWSIWKDYINI